MTELYVLLFLLVVLLGELDGATCPLHWNQDMVGKKCYKLFPKKKTWNEAKNACGDIKAKLAEPKDFKSNDFIRTHVGIKAWIGSHRCGDGATCFLNNDYVPYTPYASDEPDMKSDQQRTNQTAADLKEINFAILIQKDGKWADEHENNTYPYICEMPSEKSCAILYNSGERRNGIYTIDPDGLGSFKVWCDMKTVGGGWTVFQRRQDASVDFYRGWSNYTAGFGDLNGNFWLGLDKIHRLTNSGQNVLRVDLMDFDNTTAYAQYEKFSVASESESYKLDVGNFSGNAGDSLRYHNGMMFTTRDTDNDPAPGSCALRWKGGWWYNYCQESNLNGLYLKKGEISSKGINWERWKNDDRSMKKADMKLRPIEH